MLEPRPENPPLPEITPRILSPQECYSFGKTEKEKMIVAYLRHNFGNPCIFWEDVKPIIPYDLDQETDSNNFGSDMTSVFSIEPQLGEATATLISNFWRRPIITDSFSVEDPKNEYHQKRRVWREELMSIPPYNGVSGKEIREFFETSKVRSRNVLGTVIMFIKYIQETCENPYHSSWIEKNFFEKIGYKNHDEFAKFGQEFREKNTADRVKTIYLFNQLIGNFMTYVKEQALLKQQSPISQP